MIAQFDWWLLIVGIVGGAGLVWLIVADFSRRDDEIAADERAMESAWIAEALTAAGRPMDEHAVDEVLELHRAYLHSPAPELDPVGNSPTPARPERGGSGTWDSTPMEGDRPEG